MTPESQISPVVDFVEQAPRSQAEMRVHAADFAVLGSVLLAASGHLMIKAGLNAAIAATAHAAIVERLLLYFGQPLVVLGLVIYGLGTVMWVFAVSKRDISFVFPFTALNYVAVSLGGKFLFAETIPAKRWMGMAIVIFGIALMQTKGREASR
jgi:drug/metabolite transporter (DMT)-like permease